MKKIDMTVVILTKNEEANLTECLESLKDKFQRIVVVDSFSKDATESIAQKYNVEFVQHAFINYGNQFQWAITHLNISTKWIFRLDADERLTDESINEIAYLSEKHKNTNVNGIIFPLEVSFLGKKLRHGGTFPFKKLCIFKNGKGFMEEREMDEQIILKEGISIEMKNISKHEDFKNLHFWIDKHNWYASRAARDYIHILNKSGKDEYASLDKSAKIRRFLKYNIYYRLPSIVRTNSYFFYRYIIKLGFLDGYVGFLYAFFQAYWYRVLVYAKIYELKNQKKNVRENGE
ncbi:MAG: glycosyltransferase family 2 protein [Enterococcus lacertideformus]|uniref:Glycosyltransferase family 2 protein n=1 Tax=Enterococcus lacertideformus TaxID=2771493 RepID=A0A931AZ85_9ENTE|nr:glycosyltransferase family 2 protein [Enterococcus lacertideformus]